MKKNQDHELMDQTFNMQDRPPEEHKGSPADLSAMNDQTHYNDPS
jgi:hypothetical protein